MMLIRLCPWLSRRRSRSRSISWLTCLLILLLLWKCHKWPSLSPQFPQTGYCPVLYRIYTAWSLECQPVHCIDSISAKTACARGTTECHSRAICHPTNLAAVSAAVWWTGERRCVCDAISCRRCNGCILPIIAVNAISVIDLQLQPAVCAPQYGWENDGNSTDEKILGIRMSSRDIS